MFRDRSGRRSHIHFEERAAEKRQPQGRARFPLGPEGIKITKATVKGAEMRGNSGIHQG